VGTQNAPRLPTPKRLEFIREMITSLKRGEIVIRVSNGGILAIILQEVWDIEALDKL
tara:strand:+ start:48 stop:218 length:171 start_codon:yes stop_codon:yes gene_type:complete